SPGPGVTTGATAAIFLKTTREADHGNDRRRRPAEEEDHPRDRTGADTAVGRRIGRAGGASEGRDRAPRGEHGDQAGVEVGGRHVLQEMTRSPASKLYP